MTQANASNRIKKTAPASGKGGRGIAAPESADYLDPYDDPTAASADAPRSVKPARSKAPAAKPASSGWERPTDPQPDKAQAPSDPATAAGTAESQTAPAEIAEPASPAAAPSEAEKAAEPDLYDIPDEPSSSEKKPVKAKKPAEPDPYDLPDEPSSEAKKSAKAKKPAEPDPYDLPGDSAPSPKKSPAKKASKPKKADGPDPYDFPDAVSPASDKRPKSRKKKADAADPFDDPALTAPIGKKRKSPKKRGADDYDRLLENASRKKGGSGGGRKGGGYLTFVLSALIVFCVLLYGWRLFRYAQFLNMRSAVGEASFHEGTLIDGVDTTGMTLNDALKHWYGEIEPTYANQSVKLSTGQTVTAAEAGYASDYRQVLEAAWHAQKDGTLAQRYAALQKADSGEMKITRQTYTNDGLALCVQKLADSIDKPVREAAISGFDEKNLTFTYQEGVAGQKVNRDKLQTDLAKAFDTNAKSVTVEITEVLPTTTVEQIRDRYGLRSSAVTNASSSSSARLSNIRTALASINGTILKPGEEFSFNDTVGKRTSERGYKMAPAFSGGEVTDELGGGICQVSTTLFNAAVKADLTVTERHAHSMPVSYVDKGKDATVSWEVQDMRFVNSSDEPVYIVAYLDDKKKVRVGIFGETLPDGEYITVEAKVTKTTEYETSYQVNAFFTAGQTNVLQSGRTGYEAEAYKLRWTKDGELISKEILCYSNYKKRDEIIEIPPQ